MAALHARVLTAETGTGDAEFFHPRSVPAVAQPVTLSYVLHTSTDARDCYALGVMHSRSRGILYGMSYELLRMCRGDLCYNRCMGLLLAVTCKTSVQPNRMQKARLYRLRT